MANGTSPRKVLEHYSVQLMDLYAAMAAVGALVFCGIFTVMHGPQLTLTLPRVIFGIFRYWFVVEKARALGRGHSGLEIPQCGFNPSLLEGRGAAGFHHPQA